MSENKKAHGKCAHCGQPFTYEIPRQIWKEHPNLISLAQIYCSPQCENAERQALAKLREERERQNPKFYEKYCPKCGFVPKSPSAKQKSECRKCATRFTWREVKENVAETT